MLRQVSQGLDKIMELCHQLHSLVQTMSDPLTAKEKSQIDSIAMVRKRERERAYKNSCTYTTCNNDNIIFQIIIYFQTFSRQSSLLFRILSNVKASLSSPHLTQLLLRIDYNKFFSSHTSLLAYTSSLTTS